MSLLKDKFVIERRELSLEHKIRYRQTKQLRKDKHFKQKVNNTHTGIYLLSLGVPLSGILRYTCSI